MSNLSVKKPVVEINVINGFYIAVAGVDIEISSKKTKLLLFMLLNATGFSLQRSEVAELLWSRHGQRQALASLRQCLTGLRKVLGKGDYFLQVERTKISLNHRVLCCDLINILAKNRYDKSDIAALSLIASGDFLKEFMVEDPHIQAWLAEAKQGIYKKISLKIQGSLAQLYPRGDKARASEAIDFELAELKASYDQLLHALPPLPREAAATNFSMTEYKKAGTAKEQGFSPSDSALAQPLIERLFYLKKRVKVFWLDGYLAKSLDNKKHLTLEFKLCEQDVLAPYPLDSQSSASKTRYSLQNLIDIYSDSHGSILVLGKPGAGKTIVMLELVRHFLENEPQYGITPSPIVLNASSWRNGKSFLFWIIAELEEHYLLPEEFAMALIEEKMLLFFIDGLDELSEEYILAFIQEVNSFIKQYPLVGLSVFSRSSRYRAQQHKLCLFRGFEICDLSLQQKQAYISSISQASGYSSAEMWPISLENIATPFDCSLLQYVFGQKDAGEVNEQQMVEVYLYKALGDSGKHYFHDLKQLAIMMREQEKSFFVIDNIYYQYLSLGVSRFFSKAIPIFIVAFSVIGWIAWVTFQKVDNTLFYAMILSFSGLLGVLLTIACGEAEELRLLPHARFSLSEIYRKGYKRFVISFYAAVAPSGFFCWFYGFKVGLFFIFSIALGFIIHAGLSFDDKHYLDANRVHYGSLVKSSLLNALVAGGAGSLLGLLGDIFLFDSADGVGAVFLGLINFYLFGGHGVLQHFTTRLLLTIEGRLRFRYKPFFAAMKNKKLLYEVGRSIYFPHKIIQDFLSGKR